jgi:hypothetical protein
MQPRLKDVDGKNIRLLDQINGLKGENQQL